MRGAIPALPQYAFMEWCLVKAQGLYPFTRQTLSFIQRGVCSVDTAKVKEFL